MRARASLALIAAALLVGCAPAATSGSGHHDRDTITAQEIATTHADNAYDAIRQLRPDFLRGRGVTSIRNSGPTLPDVFVDNVEMGGIDQLHSIPVVDIVDIHYLDAAQATTRYGTGHVGGAILIRTTRGAGSGGR